MIAIIDYGAGNIFSVKNALDAIGAKSVITSDRQALIEADSIILPGVGAFIDCMKKLESTGLVGEIKRQAKLKPFLGICLGMQLLFEKGYEFGEHEGLGLLKGVVKPINASNLPIPHMGWNSLDISFETPLTEGIKNGDYVYFVHSYAAQTDDENISAATCYGGRIPAIVARGSIFGTQFHPEKSSAVGLRILNNFAFFSKNPGGQT